jgi:CheY-like chemotaxis protein
VREAAILIIDDVGDIVAEMIAMFRLVGLHCVGAGSIAEGLARLRDNAAICLIICDLRLRNEDGLNLAERLCDDPLLADRAIDIMFMTGDQAHLRHPPGATLLLKPIDPNTLIKLVLERVEARTA